MAGNDLAAIATLILLEALLSADNALVLAILARRLHDPQQRARALTLGMGLSFAFRVIGLVLAKYVIQFWFLRAAGAAYLLYLAANHFKGVVQGNPHAPVEDDGEVDTLTEEAAQAVADAASKQQFHRIVTAIALTDLAFAIDSILVAVAVTEKMWVVITGVALGIVALRLVAAAFLKLLERYPALEHTAYALVAWAGVKLGLEALHAYSEITKRGWHLEMPKPLFWVGMAVIIVVGGVIALRRPAPVPSENTAESGTVTDSSR